MNTRPKRVVLKITGEALGHNGSSFDPEKINFIVNEIKSIYNLLQLAIVVGGGNIIRGSALKKNLGTTSVVADFVGMTATIMNAMVLEDCLKRAGIDAVVQSAIDAQALGETYLFKKAWSHLHKGKVLILAAGTGNAGVTTDTGAIQRAGDINADLVIKGTKVDGVYNKDPKKFPDAEFFPQLTYRDFLEKDLSGILDPSAVTQAMMGQKPIRIFNIFTAGNLKKIINGENIGTLITEKIPDSAQQ
jgi:uridylate kinase